MAADTDAGDFHEFLRFQQTLHVVNLVLSRIKSIRGRVARHPEQGGIFEMVVVAGVL
jgi:hypothetical protein